ncbi:MAG: hypothetical protein DMF56_20610 [Acidobacteria bacterium]|nr:MAG: hypothetical protein DMF56_20610 [Acidobacteriota bacterium]
MNIPSRHRFALFRLGAYLRLRLAQTPIRQDDVMYIIDRDQSAFESYSIAAWSFVMTACYLSDFVTPFLAPLLAALAFHVPICVVGLLRKNKNNIRLTSIIAMSLLAFAAAMYATSTSWLRFVAWQFFAFVALNALAAIIVFSLRGSIEKLEAAFAQ